MSDDLVKGKYDKASSGLARISSYLLYILGIIQIIFGLIYMISFFSGSVNMMNNGYGHSMYLGGMSIFGGIFIIISGLAVMGVGQALSVLLITNKNVYELSKTVEHLSEKCPATNE